MNKTIKEQKKAQAWDTLILKAIRFITEHRENGIREDVAFNRGINKVKIMFSLNGQAVQTLIVKTRKKLEEIRKEEVEVYFREPALATN
jgi:hypothetical protein